MRGLVLSALPATVGQRLQFALKEPTRRHVPPCSDPLLRRIARDGFTVLPSYFSDVDCRLAIEEFEAATSTSPDAVHRAEDDRLFGLEAVSTMARRFQHDPRWVAMSEVYSGQASASLFIMSNRLTARNQTLGSGGDWHRDCFARELKVVIYLTDVTGENGPLQYIRGSHASGTILADMKRTALPAVANRVGDAAKKLIADDPTRLVSFEAQAGTAIVFDVSGIHRGAPIERGTRYAMTNYVTARRNHTEKTLAHYAPRLTATPGR